MRTPVVLAAPYATGFAAMRERHLRYLHACMNDSIARGEAPLNSALLYAASGVLDDDIHDEREIGIACEHAWIALLGDPDGYFPLHAAPHGKLVVYTDLGISSGMARAMAKADQDGVPIVKRTLGEEWDGAQE